MSVKKRKPYKDRVDSKEFVKAWVESKTVYEVARKLNINPQSAQQRGKKYMEKGIKLKNLPYGGMGKGTGPRININELNDLIRNTAV
jgi:hypothetical protein